MSAIELRPYQKQSLTDLWNWFGANDGSPLVVLPTGAGKSIVMAEWIRLMFEVDPHARVIVATHVRELVAQNYAELIGHWPDAPAGIYSAGLGRREMGARILFCSIQSVHAKGLAIGQCDMVLVDEAHLIPRKSDTMYQRFLLELKIANPAMKIVGLTATPFRLDSGMLHQGDGAMFDAIAHDSNVKALIDDGYLCPPICYRQAAQIDTNGVGTRGGEFIAAQLEHAALDPAIVNAIVDRVIEAGEGRCGWLIFGCTVAHCEALNAELRARGIASAAIFGETEKRDRDRAIAEFKARRLRCLVSMGVLTTGFNARHVDLIALARPTKSTGLYIQMVGRGTRLSPETGKSDCLVLDFGGNIARHGPFDDPFIPTKKRQGEGVAPFKECPECQCACGTMTRICPACGHEFPPPERVVHAVPDAKDILTAPPEWIAVTNVSYSIHRKAGDERSTPTLRVDYQCGLTWHREWLCFSHSGYARTKAEAWWMRRGQVPVPASVEAAAARVDELQAPCDIRVKKAGKYTEVVAHRFSAPLEREAAA